MGVQSWAPSPCVADGGFQVARRGRVHSATAAVASTADAARGRVESRCGNIVAYFAISRTATSRVHPTERVVWWGKATRHNSRVHSAAGKLAVVENGRGVIVGCLQQYRKR